MDASINTTDLSKTFYPTTGWRRRAKEPAKTAVNKVNLTIEKGERFGLLGPNGAGKTTLVKILSTLILPTNGTAKVGGFSIEKTKAIQQIVGLVVSDERSFYWRLTGWQNLEFFASMYGLFGDDARKRIGNVLDQVGLAADASKAFRTYSSGMRQRLAIARSLLHEPHILFLDEPSRSLDPTATSRLHKLIRQLMSHRQMTVFLITHDLAEAENLCERVAIMHHGRIQVVGRPADLRRRLGIQTTYVLQIDSLSVDSENELRHLVPDYLCRPTEHYLELEFKSGDSESSFTAVIDCLRQYQTTILNVESHSPTLEQVFTYYTEE